MDRRVEVLKHITKLQRGIEVGPWFAPLAPKCEGYNCLSLDVFDTDTLKENARSDPYVSNDRIDFIEPVDLIGTSTAIEQLVDAKGELGTFNYIISSHNFEHLPNPIKFLRGCGRVLKNGGYLSMAIPDKRVCFDYFRPHSTLGAWIEAFFDDRDRPTLTQVFEQNALSSRYKVGANMLAGFSIADDPHDVVALNTLREAFNTWVSRKESGDRNYYDAHCWMFTPSSFRILLEDARFLGLSPFSVAEISDVNGNEFYVHLRNDGYGIYSDEQISDHYSVRQILLHEVENECGHHSVESFTLRNDIASLFSQISTLGENSGAVSGKIDDLEQTIAEQRKQIEALKAVHRNEIAEIHHSSSWRLTAPFRSVMTAMRKLAS